MTPQELTVRYATSRENVRAAEAAAARAGHHRRATMLRALAGPARQVLFFDGRDGGRVGEVFGDLAGAGRVAVLVPGADVNLDKYARVRAQATRLRNELGTGSAVIVWLGYRTPSTVSFQSVTPFLADTAAPGLRAFAAELAAGLPGARLSLLCHSYGALICARAAPGLRVADIVLFGSAGVGVDNVAALRTPATVWAGRSSGDYVGRLPFTGLVFGADPISPAFGARVFPAGDGGHSDYLNAGSVPLQHIAAVVAGREGTGA